MSESQTDFSRTSIEAPPVAADPDPRYLDASPPSTPRWVKALGIVLVVLLLAFAGLHLTGNAPTHMAGADGAQHGIQLP
jgi:hypothetical protein